MALVSVIIVSFNTRELLRRCLRALEGVHEVIVVDNASSDGSADMVASEFPHVRLKRNTDNIGFGAANNIGADAATGELVLFLNSDAFAQPGAVPRLAQVFQDSEVVAAGGRLINPNGSLQQSSANALTLWAVFCEQTYLEKLFPQGSFFSPYWNSGRISNTSEVEQVMGACMMIRKGAGRFDERFFLYCEDTELCHRFRKSGKILVVPEAQFVHELGSSSSSLRWKAVALYNRGKELYFEIHGGKNAAKIAFLLDRLGALLRLIVWSIATVVTLGTSPIAREKVKLFARVLIAPRLGPRNPARKPE